MKAYQQKQRNQTIDSAKQNKNGGTYHPA